MALARITDDVLFVIIDALKVEDIILLGAASRRLRTITTNERRVWAPRLLTKELGLGTVGLDAAACASLTSLGCTPRRLCLQSLPWRVVRDGSDKGKGKAYSWRPRDDVPASLLLSAAQDFVFCEVYESGTRPAGRGTYFSDGFARKIVRLEDCDLAHFPDNVTIPLDIPTAGRANRDPWYEIRLFALVGGVLAPMGETGHCEGEIDDRWQNWSSQLRPFDDHGHTYINVNFEFKIDAEADDGAATNFRSIAILFDELEYDRHSDEVEIFELRSHLRNLGCDGETCFRNFFRRGHAVRAQPTELFATDSMTPLPFSLDGHSRARALRAAARAAELAALCAAARAAEASAEAVEATLAVARAEHAVLAAELGKMKAELGRSLGPGEYL